MNKGKRVVSLWVGSEMVGQPQIWNLGEFVDVDSSADVAIELAMEIQLLNLNVSLEDLQDERLWAIVADFDAKGVPVSINAYKIKEVRQSIKVFSEGLLCVPVTLISILWNFTKQTT